jgi:WD repeat-containing protein 23
MLTGKMAQSIEGHKDIVRDVAWHPKRNEILTSSWDYTVNINTFQDKTTEKKRLRSPPTAGFIGDDNNDLMDVAPPLRRSRRIAQRLASASTSRRN